MGEMWAVIGPNGAGKSTLLKAMMGLIKADTGCVDWQGITCKDIAYLPQQSDIDRSQPLSVYELAAMGLWHEIGFFGSVSPTQHKRVHAALAQVGMSDFFAHGIGQLSNGQFQRVLFARLLVQNAKVLLLDEPFNAVDVRTTEVLLEMLCRHQAQTGCLLIAVLHNNEQVRQYFPYALMLAREYVTAGKTDEVLSAAHFQAANDAMRRHDSAEWCAV